MNASPQTRSLKKAPVRAEPKGKTRSFALNISTVVSVCTFVLVGLVLAWSDPSAYPPGGNVSEPVNVSSTTQTKIGGFNTQGSLGIGTTSPGRALHVSGSGQYSGLRIQDTGTGGGYYDILTSDNTGVAPGALTFWNGGHKMLLTTDGKLGIGTTSPSNTLSVEGYLQVTGNTNLCSLVSYTATSGTVLCPSGYYTWSGLASTTGSMLCCKVSNPL